VIAGIFRGEEFTLGLHLTDLDAQLLVKQALLKPEHMNALVLGVVEAVVLLDIVNVFATRLTMMVLILSKETAATPTPKLIQIGGQVQRQPLFRRRVAVAAPIQGLW